MSWLGEQIVLLKEFFRTDFRRTILGCTLGLAVTVVLGAVIALAAPETVTEMLSAFQSMVEEAGAIDEAGRLSVFGVLMNNWRAMLVSAAYGFIPFLFLPVLSLLVNGVILGMLGAVYASGGALLMYAAGILPHGIFELPALILSIACGVQLCRNMCRLVVSSPRRTPMVELLGDLLRVMVLLVAPMTAAAAFIECYVTPAVMGLFQ